MQSFNYLSFSGFACLLVLFSIPKSDAQADHGDTCSDVILCDFSKFLTCNSDNICQCQPEAYYDTFQASCAFQLGQVCEDSGSQPNCITGASCVLIGTESKCQCNEGYNADGNEKCVKALEYAEFCNSTTEFQECRPDFNLQCNPSNKRCDCLEGGYVPVSNNTLCLADHGTTCKVNGQPFEQCNSELHLECQNHNITHGSCGCKTGHAFDGNVTPNICALVFDQVCGVDGAAGCYTNSECRDMGGTKKCACTGTLTPNNAKFCQSPYDGDCNAVVCNTNDFTECDADKKCKCNSEKGLIFDNGVARCALFAGANCSSSVIGCVTNSECLEEDADHFCKCIENYVASEKLCKPTNAGFQMTGGHMFVSFVGIITFFML